MLARMYAAGEGGLGSRRNNLDRDAQDTRLCLKKKVTLKQAREAVMKVSALYQEKQSLLPLDVPASNSVIAAILVHLCN